ncbi:sugar ABC transporter ATP-binding protein [uncultured Cohaesibacter sp.]|uniref:sugar ABC transporter ATP-binding protein n=1 Tax=uncultured Cohaesibacter sp. TaxID=1002546 RepID=UPI0029C9A0DB|nr:sugar ABC transporter ATP-binding protein [uncultured Cohaesibacter sp.]
MTSLVSLQNISKTFSGVKALINVEFDVEPGEVLCLLGENGSGKSTLIKVLSGVHKPDGGQIILRGKAQDSWGPVDALAAGIEVIYQDFSLFPNLSVMENIAMASATKEGSWITKWGRMRKIAQTALDRIGAEIDLDVPAEELSVAQRQLVAIARALVGNPSLIVMDEPTSALTAREIARLLEIIGQVRDEGVAVIFVSHKLDEVQQVAERVVIMRNGEKVHDERGASFDRGEIVRRMVGSDLPDKKHSTADRAGKTVLEVKDLCRASYYRDLSFTLKAGEVLGVTGQLDSGRTALALSLYGMLPPDSGSISLEGQKVELSNIRDALASGIGMVPEDRQTEGLFLSRSVGDNLGAGSLSSLANALGFVQDSKVEEFGNSWIERLSIKTPSASAFVHTLSGGNQQRVVLGKALACAPRVVVLNGPTVGVDVGSKEEIHQIVETMASEGAGVIVVSDDADEIVRLCDRLLVMSGGRITKEIPGEALQASRLSELVQE